MKHIDDHIKKHFTIDSNTGIIKRSDRRNSNGSFDKDGYLIYKIKGKQIKSHRLAWYLYYGEWPTLEIDHINRVRTDNKKGNLRQVTRLENIKNTKRKPNRITNVVGVYYDTTKGLKKNFALKKNGKTHRFYTLKEAINFKKL